LGHLALFIFPQDGDNQFMMLTDQEPTRRTVSLSAVGSLTADELAERTHVAPVTRVPTGPTGLWTALARASVRRVRAELPSVDLTEIGPTSSMFDGDPLLAIPLSEALGEHPSLI
jgi:hypothetical protein